MGDYDTKYFTCKSIAERVKKEIFIFDCNGAQRDLVWDNDRKDLFCCSLIDCTPIFPCLLNKKKNGNKDIYDGVEGQQRCTFIFDLINGNYEITENCPLVEFTNDESEKELIDIRGLTFEEFPEDIKDTILSRTLPFYILDNVPNERVQEIIYRINNGKSFTAVEKRRIKAKSLSHFQEISKHKMVQLISKNRFNHENVAMQAWTICFYENPDFSAKVYDKIIENSNVTEEQKETLLKAIETVYNFYNTLHAELKEEKSIITKITRKSHIVSCIYLAKLCNDKGLDQEKFNKIVYDFFNTGKREASVSEEYNSSVSSNTAKKETLLKRMKEIENLIN